MDAELHAAILLRCRGRCECCQAKVPPGELDHFFGKAKADENEATVWVLSVRCHAEKTLNHPDASHWLRKFVEHCDRYGYLESAQRARARLDFVDTRRALRSALGARR